MNILLVDDHELFREGIKLLLANLAEDVVFVEAPSCHAALSHPASSPLDVILLDFHLPGTHGFDALRALRAHFEQPAIVVLSAEENPALIVQAIDEGAAGFIPKTSSHAVMMAALRLVLAGGTYLPPHALLGSAPQAATAQQPGDPLAELTPRQVETLRLAMQGKANKVIAREMDVSEATVKAHLSASFRALGVRNRTEAVFTAARLGLKI
ncbi:response regulator transcription factor [Solimonas sp. SE-A11]|uniref:response regulator n=1 Tax=Solimonas sp. SE-A11 TaxID=3054954 RepID=UPI00259CACE4|nr:response regulator transcription factor [Solimonas sp. SE-A11]MDM4770193.1 response regulator transcription factor [Solimonas sp. SE-A11]